MARSRIISIIVVLALANYLVFSNLLTLLFTASTEAVTRVSVTRVPRPTFTTAPTEVPPTPTDTPMPTDTPTPPSTPTVDSATALPIVTLSATRSPTQTFTFPFTYTVKAGDTLSGLADRFLVPRAKIMTANGLTDPNFIRIGQVLIIPDPNK